MNFREATVRYNEQLTADAQWFLIINHVTVQQYRFIGRGTFNGISNFLAARRGIFDWKEYIHPLIVRINRHVWPNQYLFILSLRLPRLSI